MSQYEVITRDSVSLKNRRHAIEREFGETSTYDEIIKILENRKNECLKKIQPSMKIELGKVEDIKGVGIALLARVLATAPPYNFSTKGKYIKYLGFWGGARESKKWNRQAKSVFYLIAESTMKHRDPTYRPLYDEIKGKMLNGKSCGDGCFRKTCKKRKSLDQKVCVGRAHEVALNKVATRLAKDIWVRLHDTRPTGLPDMRRGIEKFFSSREGMED